MYIITPVRSRRVKQPKTVIVANSALAATNGMERRIVSEQECGQGSGHAAKGPQALIYLWRKEKHGSRNRSKGALLHINAYNAYRIRAWRPDWECPFADAASRGDRLLRKEMFFGVSNPLELR